MSKETRADFCPLTEGTVSSGSTRSLYQLMTQDTSDSNDDVASGAHPFSSMPENGTVGSGYFSRVAIFLYSIPS